MVLGTPTRWSSGDHTTLSEAIWHKQAQAVNKRHYTHVLRELVAEGFHDHNTRVLGELVAEAFQEHSTGNRNDGRANAGNEKHTPGPEAETVSHVPRTARLTSAQTIGTYS